jgi:UDP:flavonoid glycosyltransferase YjiC (YdhE family)
VSKILVFNVPAHGHVNPTLPVVRELVSRGEQVATT